MNRRSNSAPVIIKRRRIVKANRHHGGAWKVAYADFVTAMMAFFLLMWLLSATTENQRSGLADYFSPTIPLSRVSGGGEGMLGGNSLLTDETLAENGAAASAPQIARSDIWTGSGEAAVENAVLEDLAETLLNSGGDSALMDTALRHVLARVTDEGLIVEIFDLQDAPLFAGSGLEPEPVLLVLLDLVAEVFGLVNNGIAIEGHTRTYPLVLIDNPVWELSTLRARIARQHLEAAGIGPDRPRRVAGHADRKPAVSNPMSWRNNRLELILLRTTL